MRSRKKKKKVRYFTDADEQMFIISKEHHRTHRTKRQLFTFSRKCVWPYVKIQAEMKKSA